MAITQKMVQKLRERDPYCLHCGENVQLQMHHRRNRAMGGSKLLDRYDNLLRVCAALNYAMESDAEVAQEALENGWKLKSWDDFSKPVFDKMAHTWWHLDKDGNKTETIEGQSLF